MNTIYYADNLKILRDYIKDESVDLVYLDAPFNSNRNYNVLFRNESGSDSESQITAFEDTWHWNLAAEQTYNELINEPDQVGRMIESFRQFIGTNQMMAYLAILSVPFGNTFGTVLAAPVSALSFFLISRWDRLRGNEEFVFENLRHALGLDNIRLRPIISGVLSGIIFHFIAIYFLVTLTGVYPEDLCACETAKSVELGAKSFDSLSIFGQTGYVGLIIVGYFVVGFFSAISWQRC